MLRRGADHGPAAVPGSRAVRGMPIAESAKASGLAQRYGESKADGTTASKRKLGPSDGCCQNAAMAGDIPWRLLRLDEEGLPSASRGSLPDPTTSACELCELRPRQPLSTVLAIDGPDGLPVPFLICASCRRALDQLHALLESAGGGPAPIAPPPE